MGARRSGYSTGDDDLDAAIKKLIKRAGIGDNRDLAFEMLVSVVRMGREATDRGDLKIVSAALKELRYSFSVFEPYGTVRKVAMFGSARIRREDPTYAVARDFGRCMADEDWMIITGAGPGIMEAGIEGAGAAKAFGVNIVLPFEAEASPLIADDPKLINFRYFFTRKLVFVKEASAFALLPGGFGTMDEAFELLTLMQTGRSALAPVVLLEPEGSTYWETWEAFVRAELIEKRGLISPLDLDLCRPYSNVEDAVREVTHFYSRFHSMRYVGKKLIVRLQSELSDRALKELNRDFADIVVAGSIERTDATAKELADGDAPDLPRLAFKFDRLSYARLRHFIDRINDLS